MSGLIKKLKREALIFAALVVGCIVIVFPLSYVVGTRTFGEYAGGEGLFAYVGDLFRALFSGNLAIWFFLLSPYLALQTLRIAFAGWFRMKHSQQQVEQQDDAPSRHA